jgi:hypothetical protein
MQGGRSIPETAAPGDFDEDSQVFEVGIDHWIGLLADSSRADLDDPRPRKARPIIK